MLNATRRLYVLHPGPVTERATGKTRHLDAGELAELYGVSMDECEVESGPRAFDRRRYNHDRDRYQGMTHLRPRPDGDYTLPTGT